MAYMKKVRRKKAGGAKKSQKFMAEQHKAERERMEKKMNEASKPIKKKVKRKKKKKGY